MLLITRPMAKRKILIAGIFVLVIAISAMYVSHFSSVNRLDDVEIREYAGENLSSINDFRENSIKGTQHIAIEEYQLIVTGRVNTSLELSYSEVIAEHRLYEKVVTLHCIEGWSVTILWEGVLVKDVLHAAGVAPEAKVVIFYASDGYSTSLPVDYYT